MNQEAPTRWAPILAVVLAGIAGAAQIGKVPAAMTTIGAEFGLGLAGAAWLVGLFALMAAGGGLALGLAAARIGARRALLLGIAIGTLAALGAALAPAMLPLMAARIVEGAGFLLLTVSAPGIIAATASGRDRAFAMALWGTYMPAGVALGLLSAPLVEAWGWRSAWLALAAFFGATGLLCWAAAPADPPRAVQREPIAAQLRALVAARRPLRLALAFGTYNVIYVGIAAFLPARLETLGAGTGEAGIAAAIAAIGNAGGNLAGGALMRRGVAPALLIQAGALAMALMGAAIFVLPLPALVIGAALLACGIGGVLPAACFALLPRAVPRPELAAPAVGLVIQGNNLAQLLAPPVIGALAGLGWSYAALPLLLAGGFAVLAGRALR
jgi:MFS family permease